MKGLKGECLPVSGAQGEEIRQFRSMSVLHIYYITYICLYYHLITIIYMLISLIFNGFSIRKKF